MVVHAPCFHLLYVRDSLLLQIAVSFDAICRELHHIAAGRSNSRKRNVLSVLRFFVNMQSTDPSRCGLQFDGSSIAAAH